MEVRAYPLQNQLGNTITRLNREVDVRVVVKAGDRVAQLVLERVSSNFHYILCRESMSDLV
jgi:dUTPase